MTITVSSTDRRDGKALALFARHDLWQRGKTKDGRSFWAIPGSQPHLYHMVDCRECSCPDFQRNRNVCKHVRAVRLWMAAYKTGAVSPKREAATSAQDDRIVLTVEGAAYLAAQSVSPMNQSSDDDGLLPTPASNGHSECAITDETHATLARLRTEQKERARYLRLIGYALGEELEDGQYAQRAEHIARLEACLAHEAVAV